jgi:hypothetical protein
MYIKCSPSESDLEMPALRVAIRNTYERLFPDTELEPPAVQHQMPEPSLDRPIPASDTEDEDCPAEPEQPHLPPAKKLNYGEQVAKLFDQALKSKAVTNQVSTPVKDCHTVTVL